MKTNLTIFQRMLLAAFGFVLVCVIMFLAGAFYNVGFNISCWSEDGRFLVASFGLIGGFAAAFTILVTTSD